MDRAFIHFLKSTVNFLQIEFSFHSQTLFIELITWVWICPRCFRIPTQCRSIQLTNNPYSSVVDEYQLLARKQFLESDGEEAIIKNCKAEAMQKTWGGRSFLEEPHESDADLIANADTNGLSKWVYFTRFGFPLISRSESDSDLVICRLLFAVENVLNEEKEMDTVRNQMGNVKKTIHKAENDTKVAVNSLESWIEKQVNFVKDGICLIRPK